MAKSYRDRVDRRQAISKRRKKTSGKNSSAIKKEESSIQKLAEAPRKQHVSIERHTAGRGKTVFGMSTGSLLLLLATLLIALGTATVIWDIKVNDYFLYHSIASLFTSEEEKTYEKLAVNKTEAPGPTPENMVWIPGGWFWMGGDDPNHPVAFPIHKVYVDGFWMAKYETTNAEWEEFVNETKFLTYAEKPPRPEDFPQVPPDEIRKLKPFSLVFHPPAFPLRDLSDHNVWWKLVEGANWRLPEGSDSNIKGKEKHPVVQICWNDTQAFLRWKNKKNPPKKGWEYRLATEAEWEFAARGGMHMKKFLWGDELKPGKKWLANIWQGHFPNSNSKEDGYIWSAPVGSYPPNKFGLYDMAGNVWEWCNDWYQQEYYKESPEKNPIGPLVGFDPLEPGMPKRVQRGGSFLCDASYCERYLTYARGKGEVTSAANHIGFRYVLAPKIIQAK